MSYPVTTSELIESIHITGAPEGRVLPFDIIYVGGVIAPSDYQHDLSIVKIEHNRQVISGMEAGESRLVLVSTFDKADHDPLFRFKEGIRYFGYLSEDRGCHIVEVWTDTRIITFSDAGYENGNFCRPVSTRKFNTLPSDYSSIEPIKPNNNIPIDMAIKWLERNKQDRLVAGKGIRISTLDNGTATISAFMDSLYEIVEATEDGLPNVTDPSNNKIYLTLNPESTGTNNSWIEWIVTYTPDGTPTFEKIGEYKPEIDLSNYVKLSSYPTYNQSIGKPMPVSLVKAHQDWLQVLIDSNFNSSRGFEGVNSELVYNAINPAVYTTLTSYNHNGCPVISAVTRLASYIGDRTPSPSAKNLVEERGLLVQLENYRGKSIPYVLTIGKSVGESTTALNKNTVTKILANGDYESLAVFHIQGSDECIVGYVVPVPGPWESPYIKFSASNNEYRYSGYIDSEGVITSCNEYKIQESIEGTLQYVFHFGDDYYNGKNLQTLSDMGISSVRGNVPVVLQHHTETDYSTFICNYRDSKITCLDGNTIREYQLNTETGLISLVGTIDINAINGSAGSSSSQDVTVDISVPNTSVTEGYSIPIDVPDNFDINNTVEIIANVTWTLEDNSTVNGKVKIPLVGRIPDFCVFKTPMITADDSLGFTGIILHFDKPAGEGVQGVLTFYNEPFSL